MATPYISRTPKKITKPKGLKPKAKAAKPQLVYEHLAPSKQSVVTVLYTSPSMRHRLGPPLREFMRQHGYTWQEDSPTLATDTFIIGS